MNKQEIEKALKIKDGHLWEGTRCVDDILKEQKPLPPRDTSNDPICQINKASCMGYHDGKCHSIENCYGKETEIHQPIRQVRHN